MNPIQTFSRSILIVIVLAVGTSKATAQMRMGSAADAPTIPAVTAYIDGQEILFIHTEVSDAGIAKILTDMMGGSPVLVVPALASAPRSMLANVFVFKNGMMADGPMGPLGGQADIFDNPPGSPGYSPLRAIQLVTWKSPMASRTLKSMDDLNQAISAGEVEVEDSGVVANMPVLVWPGGTR